MKSDSSDVDDGASRGLAAAERQRDAKEADDLLDRIAVAGAVCHFCRRSRHVSVMQFNDLADRWECKDEVGCAVAGQWT